MKPARGRKCAGMARSLASDGRLLTLIEGSGHGYPVASSLPRTIHSVRGEREMGTTRLEEAIVAFREALKEWTR